MGGLATTPEARTLRVKALAESIGFDACGVAPTAAGEGFLRYLRAVEAGYTADMRWLHEEPGLRADVREVWAEARSVIVVAVNYGDPTVPNARDAPPADDEVLIARYAQGRDYHLHVKPMMVRFARALATDRAFGPPGDSRDHRVFVDTGPVLEKHFAQLAGVGWIGKNSLLIRKHGGSWCFLGVVLTPLELAPDTPHTDHCGTCTRCLDACPTGAFPEPYVLDARKCIATWTIESPSPAAVIDPESIGPHAFGCDVCQEVCPWNRKPLMTQHPHLRPRPENVRPKLAELAALAAVDDETLRARFPRSAVRRVTASQMRETLEVIAANRARRGSDSSVKKGP